MVQVTVHRLNQLLFNAISFKVTPVRTNSFEFTDLLTMSLTYRIWNFGDGTTGSTNSLLHTFKAAGSYAISLTDVVVNSSVIPPPASPPFGPPREGWSKGGLAEAYLPYFFSPEADPPRGLQRRSDAAYLPLQRIDVCRAAAPRGLQWRSGLTLHGPPMDQPSLGGPEGDWRRPVTPQREV